MMHQHPCLQDTCNGIHEPGQRYYVSATNNGRYVLLLGPYDTHQEALENVARGTQLAYDADPRAPWYAYGTLSTDATRTTAFGR